MDETPTARETAQLRLHALVYDVLGAGCAGAASDRLRLADALTNRIAAALYTERDPALLAPLEPAPDPEDRWEPVGPDPLRLAALQEARAAILGDDVVSCHPSVLPETGRRIVELAQVFLEFFTIPTPAATSTATGIVATETLAPVGFSRFGERLRVFLRDWEGPLKTWSPFFQDGRLEVPLSDDALLDVLRDTLDQTEANLRAAFDAAYKAGQLVGGVETYRVPLDGIIAAIGARVAELKAKLPSEATT